ncbi:MAG: hypothetical protein JRJ19_08725 [Deltaproteobacteria bacterium]|nr:hypothetical protein [Deltaproteobacteria bacterium]
MPVNQLVLRFKGGAQAKLELAMPAGDEDEAKSENVPYLAGKIIPLDSRLVFGVAGADLTGLWENFADRMEKPAALKKRMKFSMQDDLLAKLEKRVIFVVGGADTSAKRPVPHLVAIMKTGKAPAVEAAMQKLFAFTFGVKPKKKVLKDMGDRVMYHFPGRHTFTPAFALVDNWLVVGTTEEMVRKVIATSVGHQPSIHDLPGFGDKVAAAKKPYYVLSYVDCNLLFEDLKNYSDTIIKIGDRFGSDDIEDTLTPFWQALKKVGKLGGTLTLDKAGLSGTVVAL